MILIVGGTGVLGRRTARLLLAEGHAVRVMTRDPARASELEHQGAEVVCGDLLDTPSVAAACRGIERVFAAAHSILGRGRYRSEYVDDAGHRALVDAAREAGVRRFVYTSALGASPDHPVDFFRTKYRLEQYIVHSGLQHVLLRPAAFMEWHAHEFNGRHVLERGRVVLLGSDSKKRSFVAASDVAHAAARALVDDEMLGRVVAICGPGEFADGEVAMMYANAAAVTPTIVRVPGWLVALLGQALRPLHPGIARIMRMASAEGTARAATPDPSCTAFASATPPTRLQDFVQDQVARARTAAPNPHDKTMDAP
jgi:uncharacterized protein YbjT (DUF2867 family)